MPGETALGHRLHLGLLSEPQADGALERLPVAQHAVHKPPDETFYLQGVDVGPEALLAVRHAAREARRVLDGLIAAVEVELLAAAALRPGRAHIAATLFTPKDAEQHRNPARFAGALPSLREAAGDGLP
ncbi:MAG: hypothetical protein C3F10_07235 [Dehalococcoidia bacterium]|nr:MAG: hypothetical protein C3F10_07235 [Dehalococcoidia bacterium]